MIHFQPEITLPNNLEISYPQEVLDWIKENTAGMKYIAIKKILDRGEFKQLMRITLQDNPTHAQKPEENPALICETIYKVIQYDIEGEDSEGNYRIVIYRKMQVGNDKPVTKHVSVNTGTSGDKESNIFNPDKRDTGDLLDKAMTYIGQLHDTLAGMNNFAAQIIGPVIDMNTRLQATIVEQSGQQVRIKEIEMLNERERENEKIRLLLEKDRIAASARKWETAMKTMNKNGALDKIMGQVVNKFLGDGQNQTEIKIPPPRKPKPVAMQMTTAPQEKVEDKNEEEMKKQVEKQIEEDMRIRPLYTSCNCLKLGLNQDEEENPDSSIKEYMKETLSQETFENLMEVLNSENEEDAKSNLIALQENINDNPEEIPKLILVKNRFSEGQQKIIMNILNYKG